MSLDQESPTPLVIPEVHRRSRGPWLLGLALAVGGAATWAWASGFRVEKLWASARPVLATVAVDRGDLDLVVTENGTVESADNATVRCQVEALMGLTGGTAGANGARGGTAGGQGAQGNRAGNGTANGQAQGGASTQQATPAAQPAAKSKAAAKSKTAAKGAAKAKATGAGVASASPTESASGGGAATKGAGGAGGAASGDGSESTGIPRPDIRSFSYIIEPHVPLRPTTKSSTSTSTQMKAATQGTGGSGGRGGGGGGRGGDPNAEMPGSTRIISILPEGTPVKAGDVVCVLDSAAFKDELQAQEIRYTQAKAWVEQAKSILEVEEISLREYEEGIYPQDLQLIRQYIQMCETNYGRAKKTYEWSVETVKKNFRTTAQLNADALSLKQTEISLNEAKGMLVRLEKFTGKRIEAARKAKIEAVRADKLSLDSAFQLEKERKERLEKMIEYCTLRAPRDGIVVYASQANRWGQVQNPIQEGVTVRQSQPIFNLPNPNFMQVKAKINESKVSLVQSGQPALIHVDAFPDQPLKGTVTEITPISAPANGPISDVRIYYATVRIDGKAFDSLRPGLSAEVDFRVDSRRNVIRVPLEAIRWVGNQAFAALATNSPEGLAWRWKPVTLGLSDSTFGEVLSGLEPGDRVIDHPDSLPAPKPVLAKADDKDQLVDASRSR